MIYIDFSVLYLLLVFFILIFILINILMQMRKFYTDQIFIRNICILNTQVSFEFEVIFDQINILLMYKLWYIIFFKYLHNDNFSYYIPMKEKNVLVNYIYKKINLNLLSKKY